ncbi:MAG TPA: hypothetical protein VKB46_16710 [Pyrinomonadaceae bacterium]|nr:hypothetical protein [Pyrinomonadaceae bacterium]
MGIEAAAKSRRVGLAPLVVFVALANACSTLQPPDANGPRADVRQYPVAVLGDSTRQAENLLAWRHLTQSNGAAAQAEVKLNPATATLQRLPSLTSPIFLPAVGEANQTEGQIRESLRRFIAEWKPLIGADLTELSLVERTDEAAGVRLARYEQRPFRYPLRGAFGSLVIRFTTDRKVVDISSTCLPDAKRLESALAEITPKLTAEDAANNLTGRSITVPSASGPPQTFTVATLDAINVRQLVVYAKQASDQPDSLGLHLAWEIDLKNAPVTTIYLDAVESQVLGAA